MELARKHLGDKLTATYTDTAEMLKKEKPVMALVSLEARIAPPAIDLALDAGCHVMAEKPACLNAEDFAKLTKKANDKKLLLMLALAESAQPGNPGGETADRGRQAWKNLRHGGSPDRRSDPLEIKKLPQKMVRTERTEPVAVT